MGLFIIPIIGYFLSHLYQQLVLGESSGTNTLSDLALILATTGVVLIGLFVLWLLTMLNIEIKIADKVIYYRFQPFINKVRTISIADIESWSVIKRSPFITGIGIRFDPIRKAKILSTGSSHFLVLKLKTGKCLMLSTKNPEQLELALNSTENVYHE